VTLVLKVENADSALRRSPFERSMTALRSREHEAPESFAMYDVASIYG